jgi:flavin-binding protein dodecin
MNESIASAQRYTGKIRTKYAEAAAERIPAEPITVEFVGASDATIAEAVRNALARASASVGTLDGVGVLVIPQILNGAAPRYRVTLQVTAGQSDVAQTPPSPSNR